MKPNWGTAIALFSLATACGKTARRAGEAPRPDAAADASPTCGTRTLDDCLALAFDHQTGTSGRKRDWQVARRLFEEACGRGSGEACADTAELLILRHEATPERVMELLMRACHLGHLKSCSRAGWMVIHEEPARAEGILLEACDEKSDAASCAALYWLYAKGPASFRDRTKARRYDARSDKLGYVGE